VNVGRSTYSLYYVQQRNTVRSKPNKGNATRKRSAISNDAFGVFQPIVKYSKRLSTLRYLLAIKVEFSHAPKDISRGHYFYYPTPFRVPRLSSRSFTSRRTLEPKSEVNGRGNHSPTIGAAIGFITSDPMPAFPKIGADWPTPRKTVISFDEALHCSFRLLLQPPCSSSAGPEARR